MPQFNSALSALATLNAPMQTKASHDSQQKCQQPKAGATASQLFCLAALTLKKFPASSLPLMAEW